MSFRKVSLVPFQERLWIILQEVNFAAEFLLLACLESADARVVVQADDHSLKQFLRLVPRHRQQIPIGGGDAADQAVDGLIETDRARVNVIEIDSFGYVNLAPAINRFFGS